MGIFDGDFEIPDWLSSIGTPGDPMAGSDFIDVAGDFNPIQAFQWPGWGGLPSGGTGINSSADDAGSVISKLFGNGKSQGYADAASVLGKLSSGEKANRSLMAELAAGHDRTMLDAQTGRNQNESDAMRKLAQTGYILNGGSQFKLPSIEMNGRVRTPPNFGYGPSAPSEAQKQGASTLQGQLLQRLQPGGSYQPQSPSDFSPGLMEQIGNFGALTSGGMGAINTIMNGREQPQQPDIMSVINRMFPQVSK